MELKWSSGLRAAAQHALHVLHRSLFSGTRGYLMRHDPPNARCFHDDDDKGITKGSPQPPRTRARKKLLRPARWAAPKAEGRTGRGNQLKSKPWGGGCRAQGFLKQGLGRPATGGAQVPADQEPSEGVPPEQLQTPPPQIHRAPHPHPSVAVSLLGWRQESGGLLSQEGQRAGLPQMLVLPHPQGDTVLTSLSEPEPCVFHLWHQRSLPGPESRVGTSTATIPTGLSPGGRAWPGV